MVVTTKIVPLDGNNEVDTALIVPVGKVTLLEGKLTVVAPCKYVPLLKSTMYELVPTSNPVIKKHPELYCGLEVLLKTNILPLSTALTVLVATGIETLNSLFNPRLIPARVLTAKVGAAVGVESAVEINNVPIGLIG